MIYGSIEDVKNYLRSWASINQKRTYCCFAQMVSDNIFLLLDHCENLEQEKLHEPNNKTKG